ncbi:MAG: hypothetical protein ACYTEQ_20765 [Planctomycetota bacterium]|jgi:hypothetical protein
MATPARWIIKVAYYDVGTSTQTAWTDYDSLCFLLTEYGLSINGGRPYYSGTDWKCVLAIVYEEADGTQEGLTLTGATITLEAWNAAGVSVFTETLVADADQTSRNATPAGNRGECTLTRADTETADPGEHALYLKVTDASANILMTGVGRITVRQAPS